MFCKISKISKTRISLGKQPIKKNDPKSSVPKNQPIDGATPSVTLSAGTNPFAAEPASTTDPSVNPFDATSTNTAPALWSSPLTSQQPPQAVPFGSQPTAVSSSSVQNPFGAASGSLLIPAAKWCQPISAAIEDGYQATSRSNES